MTNQKVNLEVRNNFQPESELSNKRSIIHINRKRKVHQKPTTAHLKQNLKECIQRKNKTQKVSAEDTIPTNSRKLSLSSDHKSQSRDFFQQYKIHDGIIWCWNKNHRTKYKEKITVHLASKQILNERTNQRYQSQWKMS